MLISDHTKANTTLCTCNEHAIYSMSNKIGSSKGQDKKRANVPLKQF